MSNMNSPLGKYAPLVAAIVATAVVGSWIAAELLHGLGVLAVAPAGLKEAALLALGAVFGSAVVANGHKAPMRAAELAHARLDAVGAPHIAGADEP